MPRKERNGHRVLEPEAPGDILIQIAATVGRLEGQLVTGMEALKERMTLHAEHHGARIEDLTLRVGHLEASRAAPASRPPRPRLRDLLPVKELLLWFAMLAIIGTVEIARLILPPEALGLILKLAPAAASAK